MLWAIIIIKGNAKGSKKLEELKEGQQYKIIYDEKDAVNNEGIPFVSKTAFGFYNVASGEKTSQSKGDIPVNDGKGNQSPLPNALVTALQPDLSKFEDFRVKYLTMLKSANMQPNPVHMLGSFISTYEPERVMEFREKCKEALK